MKKRRSAPIPLSSVLGNCWNYVVGGILSRPNLRSHHACVCTYVKHTQLARDDVTNDTGHKGSIRARTCESPNFQFAVVRQSKGKVFVEGEYITSLGAFEWGSSTY